MERRALYAMLLMFVLAAAVLSSAKRVEAFEDNDDAAFAERKLGECDEKKKEILKEIEEIKADRAKTMKRPTEIAKTYQDNVERTEQLKKEIEKMKADIEVLSAAIPALQKTSEKVAEYKKKLSDYVSYACF